MVKNFFILIESLLLVLPIRSGTSKNEYVEPQVTDQDYETFLSYSPSFKAFNNTKDSPGKVYMGEHNFKEIIKDTYMEFDISYERRYSDVSCYIAFFIFSRVDDWSSYRLISTSYDAINYMVLPTLKQWTVRLYLSGLKEKETEAMIYVSDERTLRPRSDIRHAYCTFMITNPNYTSLVTGFNCIYYGIEIDYDKIKNYVEIIYLPGQEVKEVDNPYRFAFENLKLITTEVNDGTRAMRAKLTFADPDSLYRKISESELDNYTCTVSLEPVELKTGEIYTFSLKNGYYLDRNYFSVDKNEFENSVFVKDYLFFTRTHHDHYKTITCTLEFPKFGNSTYHLNYSFTLSFPDGDYLDYIKITGIQSKKRFISTMEEVVI